MLEYWEVQTQALVPTQPCPLHSLPAPSTHPHTFSYDHHCLLTAVVCYVSSFHCDTRLTCEGSSLTGGQAIHQHTAISVRGDFTGSSQPSYSGCGHQVHDHTHLTPEGVCLSREVQPQTVALSRPSAGEDSGADVGEEQAWEGEGLPHEVAANRATHCNSLWTEMEVCSDPLLPSTKAVAVVGATPTVHVYLLPSWLRRGLKVRLVCCRSPRRSVVLVMMSDDVMSPE